MITENRKKILLIIGYCILTLALGIVVFRLNTSDQRKAPTPSEYTDTKDVISSREGFSGGLRFELTEDPFIPENLFIYEKSIASNIDIPNSLGLVLTKSEFEIETWESTKWKYTIDTQTGNATLSSVANAPTPKSANQLLEDADLIDEANALLNRLDVNKDSLQTTVLSRGDRYIVNYTPTLQSYPIIQRTEPLNVFSVHINSQKNIFYMVITRPEVLTASRKNEVMTIKADEILQISPGNIQSFANVYTTFQDATTLETEHAEIVLEDIPAKLQHTIIDQIEIAYQVKIEKEERLVLPVLLLKGKAFLTEDTFGEITIVYPALR